jgi:branched-chain amino acid transport system ATP-binding protein
MLLTVRGLQKHFRGVVATDDLDLDLSPGELHAVIGPNGAGKTTLINQLSGELLSDAGTIIFQSRDITRDLPQKRAREGISRSYQITSVIPDFSALENAEMAVLARTGGSFGCWKRANDDPALASPAVSALERVGLKPLAHRRASELAHGERRQLELAMALATEPKLLLLDEPMAGMSHVESQFMIRLIQSLKGTCGIILVEHDMDAVFALADRVTVLMNGRCIARGTPEEIRSDQAVKDAYLGDQAGLE